MQESTQRDLVRWQVEGKAREPFLKAFKGDTNNMQLTVDYMVWNAIENLEKAAYTFHTDVKNFWKWVKKVLMTKEVDDSAVKQHLFNVVYFFVFSKNEELAKWKQALMNNNAFYYPSCF